MSDTGGSLSQLEYGNALLVLQPMSNITYSKSTKLHIINTNVLNSSKKALAQSDYH